MRVFAKTWSAGSPVWSRTSASSCSTRETNTRSGRMSWLAMPLRTPLYTNEFFKGQQGAVQRSARAMVPFVVQTLAPKSVIDVGCGTGTWLATFLEHGMTDVFGVDGD